MLIAQQIAERQQRATASALRILKRPSTGPYGDYAVKPESSKTYEVAIRSLGLFENYYSCPDFAAAIHSSFCAYPRWRSASHTEHDLLIGQD